MNKPFLPFIDNPEKYDFSTTVKLGYNELDYNEHGYNERFFSVQNGHFATLVNPVITKPDYNKKT